MQRMIKRVGSFAFSTAFLTVVSVAAVPLAIRNLGAGSWGNLALAQAIAAIFAIFVAFGWGAIGAATTASTPARDRPAMYVDSLVSRGYLFLAAVGPMALTAALLVKTDAVGVFLATFAYTLPSLGASWYFVGQSRPWRLFCLDVLPQGLGTIAGVVATSFVSEVRVYAGCQLLFNALAVIASAVIISRKDALDRLRPSLSVRKAMLRLRGQWPGVIAAGAGTINSYGPIIAVRLLANPLLPTYALADKVYRFGVAGFAPVLQVIQGWIPEAGPSQTDARVRRVSMLAPVFGVVGGAAIALVMPWASRLLSNGQLHVGWDLSLPFGLIFCGVIIAQIIGLACLIPIGKGADLARSTAAGAALNVVLMIGLGLAFGAVGVAWAVAAGELLVCTYQIVVVRNYLAVRPHRGADTGRLARAEPSPPEETSARTDIS